MIKELIEILKFKITIFMSIIAGAFYLAINIKNLPSIFGDYGTLIVFFLIFYGVFGFVFNMIKLTKIQKDLQ
jgi:hypothetical protein